MRPRFMIVTEDGKEKPGPYKWLYDVFSVIVNMLALDYAGSAFLVRVNPSSRYSKSHTDR